MCKMLGMTRAKLNKSEKMVANTTKATKYIQFRGFTNFGIKVHIVKGTVSGVLKVLKYSRTCS